MPITYSNEEKIDIFVCYRRNRNAESPKISYKYFKNRVKSFELRKF